jgi:pimeloyl-ACP methyl ester carboxylesterase
VTVPSTIRRATVAMLPLLLVVAACSVGPSERPAVAARDGGPQVTTAPSPPKQSGVPGLGPQAQGSLEWADCTAQTVARLATPAPGTTFSCATMMVPLNAPNAAVPGPTRIALLSVGTGRIPLVVLNDAGGEPGTTFAARLALRMPPEMLHTFQIIGMDRRGTGQSDAPQCVSPQDRQTIVGFDPQAIAPAALQQLAASANSAMQGCLASLAERLQAYDASRTASDLEQLREQSDVPKLHTIGVGEAAQVLTTFAEVRPESVGRMVFDGAPNPTLDARAQSEAQAQGAEGTFDAFATDCVRRGCPLGPDPRRTVTDLVQRTRTAPLPASAGPVTAGMVVEALLLGLADRSGWPRLASALAAGASGDGAQLGAMAAPLVSGNAANPARLDADLITSCNDTQFRLPSQLSATTAESWVRTYPLFGGLFAQRLIRCSTWPLPQQAPAPPGANLPPIVVVSTAQDPLTPAQGTARIPDQLPSAVLVNWQGAGHGALLQSDCVIRAVSGFLTQGRVPVNGMACP